MLKFIPSASLIRRSYVRQMATASADPSHTTHEQRTATDPRAPEMQTALIRQITQATKDVRLIDFELQPPGPFKFKAGQWLDCFTPASEQAGGFSIVSAPAQGLEGTFRLAIQRADRNPPAAWLWRKKEELENNQTIDVRVGGQFCFPPVNFRRLQGKVSKVTLIAGGIGSNPMLSILGALRDANAPLDVTMLYGIKNAEDALYLDELSDLCNQIKLDLSIFCSKSGETEGLPGTTYQRRFKETDLDATIGEDMETNLYYICGPAKMTDFVQEHLLGRGIPKDLVQTERWW